MLELKKLEFGGIRRFAEMQEIDFTNRDKLIQVDGKNLNTGGSSGAGKTTVFLALDYLLGISDIPSTVLQSRITTNTICVTGEFVADGKPLKITRGKKTGLVVEHGDETISGNVKLAEEKIDEIIGIPRNVFKNMVHKKQKEGGFFINMTGKATYEFLSSVLGLDPYTQKSNKIKEDLKQIQAKLSSFEDKKASQEKLVKQIEEQIGFLEKPKPTDYKDNIKSYEEALAMLKGQKIDLDAKYSFKLSSLEEPKLSLDEFDSSELGAVCADITKCERALKKLQDQEMGYTACFTSIEVAKEKVKNLGAEIKKLKEQKAKIEQSVCPTCEQSWVTEAAQTKIEDLSGEIDQKITKALELKKEIDREPELRKDRANVEQNIEKVEKMLETAKARKAEVEKEKDAFEKQKNTKYRKELNEFKEEYKQIEEEHLSKVEPIEKEINSINMSLAETKAKYDAYQREKTKYDTDLKRLSSSLSDAKSEIEDMVKSNESLVQKEKVVSETQRLIKSYILQTFQETLDLIGDMATQILSGIPNMANSTIYFEGCKENKDGSIKNEVSGIINMDGENIPIKSLSGGERTAIDLAVDLAVIDVIETKVGKGADFYIIDEPFDGLDAVCRENSLEILNQVDTNKRIIVVDHSSELKEMVNEVITVIREGEESRIEN